MTITFSGLFAPTDVPTGDGRMFAPGKLTHRPLPIPLLARFSSGGHDGATVVGKITNIFEGPGGYWAAGEFLDPQQVPEVGKAIYMIQNKVMGPSVDLDRDFTVESVPHPIKPDKKAGLFKEYNVIGTTLVPMPAFHQVHMSIGSQEEKSLLASIGIDGIDVRNFFVNDGDWRNWPIAPRNYKFDADDAVKRIAYWAGIGSEEPALDKYASTFLWRRGDDASDNLAQDSFRLPLADIINGEPYLIYHAVYAAAALLSGAHGGVPLIPDTDKAEMVPVINSIYAYLAEAFNDENLKSPFLEHIRQSEAAIDGEEFNSGTSIFGEGASECGCDTFSGETEEVVPMQGDGPVATTGQTFTLGTDQAQGAVTVTTGAPVQSITFMMTPNMPTSVTVPTGVPTAMGTGGGPSETITVIPVDVLKSAEEEKRPYGPDGCHFEDGMCVLCQY